MKIAVDIGNSNIVIGVWVDARFKHSYRIESTASTDASYFDLRLRQFLLEDNLLNTPVEAVAISSVVPALLPCWEEVMHALAPNIPATVVQPELYKHLPVKTINPTEIGSDLVCNATAAWLRYQQAVIVVDFGTALTFTGVDGEANIAGVAIAPGIKTALNSLVASTAKLPEVKLEVPPSVLGKNTTQAMQSGIMLGYEAMAEGMIARLKKEMGEEVKVIATGGMAASLPALSNFCDAIDGELTLTGLLAIDTIVRKTSL